MSGALLDGALAEKVAFLKRPEVYPDAPDAIETIETHFAFVFLSRDYAFKLKKPVEHGEVDYTSLAARRAACELEVALNRRLAAPVYLGVVALTRSPAGLELDGLGVPADWLVQMRRLPRDRTLDRLAHERRLTDSDLRALVATLRVFYAETTVAPWPPEGYRRRLRDTAAEASARLSELGPEISAEIGAESSAEIGAETRAKIDLDATLARIFSMHDAFLRQHSDLVGSRARDGRVVDAHGDLRPEHVFLDGEPQIIDCLEFSQALRWLDSAEEMAFLALECERLGFERIGARLLELYSEISEDPVPPGLLAFYRARRAVLRAVLAGMRIRKADHEAERSRWRERARWYLRAAEHAAAAALDGNG